METSTTLDFLLVTEDYAIFKTVRIGLQQVGARFGCLNTIAAAQDYVERRRVDGIILDLAAGDAIDFITVLRKGTSNRRAVVFACLEDHLQSSAVLQAGAQLLLQKPIMVEHLVSKVAGARDLMVQERRRYFRHSIFFPVLVTTDGNEQRAMITNISERGMAVHTTKPPACSSFVDFCFQLPEGPTISGKGQIVWANTEGVVGIGFHLLRGTGKEDLLAWFADRERFSSMA
jgi:DNA-binding NarL/FixJ family response regulator